MSATSTAGVGFALTPELYGEVIREGGIAFDFLELDPDAYHLTESVEATLAELAASHPMTLHSTELSICGDNELDERRLAKIERMVRITGCDLYSDHLSYTWAGDVNLDLYMSPEFSDTMLDHLARRVDVLRRRVGCEIALENVGMLLAQPAAQYSEVDFIAAALKEAGISLQLNLDSVAISAETLGLAPEEYLTGFPLDRVSLVTVVPETSMNPVLRRRYGSEINVLMLRMLDYVLSHCDVSRMMVQGRRGDIPEEFIAFYTTAHEAYYRHRSHR